MVSHMLKQTRAGNQHFPFVLMLEPTLKCNLDCIGCGRIAEYKREHMPDLTLQQCLDGVEECGAPIVSVCGGEPLVYPPVVDLVAELIRRKKYVYLCTNALLLDRYWDRIPPSPWMALSIHLDGLEKGHDWAVDRPGTFKKVSATLDEAIRRGYRVVINTTVYNGSNPEEILELLEYLHQKKVHGMLLSAAYPQEGEKGNASLNTEQMKDIFSAIFEQNGTLKKYKFNNSPMYIDFLLGKRELECTPWGSPNLTPKGWKGPCYVLTDGYYKTYQELIEKTDWDHLGPGKDPRCQHCKIHSGFEPTIARGKGCTMKDHLRMIQWNLL
jgi:hopanoid biosynthesis associated radical SAM protein HpnH